MKRLKGLLIKCPICGNGLNIRDSQRPSACLTQASVYCADCHLKGVINAELSQIQLAEFHSVADNHQWQQDEEIKKRLLKKKRNHQKPLMIALLLLSFLTCMVVV
ncbi:transposase [Gallibacterium anatis]|uniref:transposase n=1 Tax=Gallibacterium anatis TaxID=750 RepID=UPI00266F7CB7|nr:transposase [Gallibacterium anatis]WKS97184.1 transposase [Gallibacterium anatis]